jgi:hypothetical protein
VYLAFATARLSPHETWYVPEGRAWFGRVSELAGYSEAFARPHETVLCVEIPEGRWGRSARFDRGAPLEALVGQLHDARIVPRSLRPIDAAQRFVPDVYPLYVRGFHATWERALDAVAALENVVPFGRQGLFLHCNVDHSIAMAAEAVAHVAARGSFDAWRSRARAWLGVRVRD